VKASAMLGKEHVSLNPFVAAVDPARCDGVGRCVVACEYDGALTLVEEERDGRTVRRAVVNPGLCVGCGSCVGVCPQRAIDLQGWRVDQYEAMVDGIMAGVD
jgi:heterodisulfide reductase subunit A